MKKNIDRNNRQLIEFSTCFALFMTFNEVLSYCVSFQLWFHNQYFLSLFPVAYSSHVSAPNHKGEGGQDHPERSGSMHEGRATCVRVAFVARLYVQADDASLEGHKGA